MKSYIKQKIKRNSLASVAIAGLLAFIIASEMEIKDPFGSDRGQPIKLSALDQKPSTTLIGSPEIIDTDFSTVEEKFEARTRESVKNFDPSLAALLANQEFDLLRERLLKLAAVAVADDDKNRLGYILNLLGQIAIQEQDLFTAQVFLNEALDIFDQLYDETGSAQVHMQLGRTHLKSRQIARVAGTAYDELQVGRWYLAKGILDVAEEYIVNSIDKNMSVNRYGSAASAYESLTRLYSKNNKEEQMRHAAFEAARLFSASGNMTRAEKVLSLLPDSMKPPKQLAALDHDIESNYSQYKNGILQIERAKDYRRLYHYYRNVGDNERAWKFRLLANDSLADVSKRALFHRQQGVLAILYNSNESMDLAEDYFLQAKQTFDFNGLDQLSDETQQLNSQVY